MNSGLQKIAVACVENPAATSTWSGIPAHLIFALQKAGINITQAGPLVAEEPFYYRWLRSLYWRLGQGWFMSAVEPKILRQRSRALQQILQSDPAAAVISIQSDPLAATVVCTPTALIHDCTFALLIDYYKAFSGLSKRSLELGHRAYQQALDHASVAIFSSEWAAKSAINDYDVDSKKVHVVEFGANLKNPPSKVEVEQLIETRLAANVFHFLFLGVEWERKGGKDAVALIRVLHEIGIPAHLDVVGCRIPNDCDKEFTTEHGFLDKSSYRDSSKLRNLFEKAAFLLVPSLAECYGCVYCEANAFGVPGIGRRTGGVGQIIKPHTNGFLLAQDSSDLFELANVIKDYLLDNRKYKRLAESSRNEFELRLNWDRFVERILELINPNVRKNSPEMPELSSSFV